jgi:hypothetical protein
MSTTTQAIKNNKEKETYLPKSKNENKTLASKTKFIPFIIFNKSSTRFSPNIVKLNFFLYFYFIEKI